MGLSWEAALLRNSKIWLLVLVVAGASCFVAGMQAYAGKPAAKSAKAAGPRQCVFSRSNRPTTAGTLGITGVPAYVVFPNGGQQVGVYIMQGSPGGVWASMGLRPGRVLLTIDGRVAQSPSSVDNILSNKSGSIDYTYVRVVDGVPEMVRGRANYGGPALGMAPAVSSTPDYSNPGKLQDDKTPLSQLESHMGSLINKDRQANGQPSISENGRLAALARDYAEYLLKNRAFSHEADGRNPLQRARAHGIGGGIAENLAFEPRGQKSDKDGVNHAQAVFMAEPPNQQNHRGNILWNEAKSFGVGMARDKGQLMMVQEFSDGTP